MDQKKISNSLPKKKQQFTQMVRKQAQKNPNNKKARLWEADFIFLFGKSQTNWSFNEKDNKKRKYQLPKNETIKDIASSSYTYQILTESGKVWSLDNSNHLNEVPFLDADQSTFEKIRPVTFFEEKKLFVNSLTMALVLDIIFVVETNCMPLDRTLMVNWALAKVVAEKRMPAYVQDKVSKIFAGNQASNFFFTTNNPDLLYACGRNKYGQLGVGSYVVAQNTPTIVQNFQGSEILTVSLGYSHSILITKKGQTYGCGDQ
ncbi:hypothetical protein M0813_11768 [Anaeramoeba flamelloides]|uniref:Uncharacterized protein n=1 Tax=Anaeramoeba flamelloides TaxID=1746091 RepID=A0ABQ8ZDY3_9EUKA|nr:hypothetical protein M0813_11768 [Anaeramoeba flamelloides]